MLAFQGTLNRIELLFSGGIVNCVVPVCWHFLVGPAVTHQLRLFKDFTEIHEVKFMYFAYKGVLVL